MNFLNIYSDILEKAENKYSVCKQDLDSILMWESGLGKFTGSSRVFNIFIAQILFIDSAQKFALNRLIRKEGANPLANSSFRGQELKRICQRSNSLF